MIISAFEEWKAIKEEEEQTCFTKEGTGKTKEGDNVQYYQCNRSGTYKPRVSRKRHLKPGGKMFIVFSTKLFLFIKRF